MSQRDVSSWLPSLIGPAIKVDGEAINPPRKYINLVDATAEDDADNDAVNITIAGSGGGGGATPGGGATLESFGAVGNGVTDDTAAYDAAIAAFNAGTITWIILSGNKTYLLNPSSVHPYGLSVVGQGPSSIIKTTGTRAVFLMHDTDLADRKKLTRFANFHILGSASGSLGAGAPANQNGIEIGYLGGDGSTRIEVDGVTGYRLDRFFSVGYVDELSAGPRVSNCLAEECKYGYYAGTNDYSNCQAIRCNIGVAVSGNVQFNGTIEFCNIGVDLMAGGNDGHGVFTGRLVHNTTPIRSTGALLNGFLFLGIELFEGTISIANGNTGAIIFQGGQIDATIYNLNGKSRWLGVTFDTGYGPSSVSTTNGENEFVDCLKRDMTVPTWIQTLVRKSFTPVNGAQTLPSQDSWAEVLSLQPGASAPFTITNTRSLTRGNKQFVKNLTTQTCTFQWATGASVTLAAGLSAWIGATENGACIDFLGSATGAEPSSGIDPTTIDYDGLWLPSYSGAPWAATASAGSSSGRNLVAGVAPATGSAVNGSTPADFNGSTHILTSVSPTTDQYLGTTAYTVELLLNPDVAQTDTGTVYTNPGVLVEAGGNWGIVYSSISGTAKLSVYHASTLVASVAVPVTTWTHVMFRFGLVSGEMDIFVNGAKVSHTTSVAATGGLAQALRMGRNFGSGTNQYFDGKVMLGGMSQTAHADATCTGRYAKVKADFPAMSLP